MGSLLPDNGLEYLLGIAEWGTTSVLSRLPTGGETGRDRMAVEPPCRPPVEEDVKELDLRNDRLPLSDWLSPNSPVGCWMLESRDVCRSPNESGLLDFDCQSLSWPVLVDPRKSRAAKDMETEYSPVYHSTSLAYTQFVLVMPLCSKLLVRRDGSCLVRR